MNISTIGTGTIVESFIKGINLAENASLEAVFSRSESKAKAFADSNKAKKFYTNIDEMLKNKDSDTIYIASPNSLHYEQALKALEAGKNVIIEKPFVSTLKQANTLFNIAKEKGLFVFEAISTIHLPNYKIIKENLHKVGKIKLLTLNFSQFSSRYLKYINNEQTNVFDPKFSGGALADLNVYNIHFTVGLAGKPKSYKYYPNVGYNGIDTSGVMILAYDDFTATLIAAKDSTSEYLFFIQGDKGTIRISGSSCGVCKNVDLFLLGDSAKNSDGISKFKGFSLENSFSPIGINQVHHLSYEIADFARIVKEKDYAEYEKLKEQTLTVMEIMFKARTEAGIKFAADAE
ncbi:MAG: Gfo/Idh/MocA family oxidoreductase [Elusimicrobiota bacterium]|jgi:predicted dehydrogenase|nr:Gfo/Idh/MocA family oxidoreductase [Elusimicrobiota bacterium]